MISATTKAPATGSSIINKPFSPSATNIERKAMIIGTYDPTITTVDNNEPQILTSAKDAGVRYGFGTMLHRLVLRAFLGGKGVQIFATPQSEAGGAVVAAGNVLLSGAVIGGGTYAFYIAGLRVAVSVAAGDTPAAIATKLAAAVTADDSLPVSAVVNGGTPEQVDFTAKSKGPWGNDIDLSIAIIKTDLVPTNLGSVITVMVGGAGIPDIQEALDGMGTGDDKNSEFWTGLSHGYGQDTTTLDTIAAWVGLGNTLTGLYDKLVHRPIRISGGDVQDGSAGFTALIALGDGRKQDRGNGTLAVPGSETHPSEIAAQAIGLAEIANSTDANKDYEDRIMVDVRPGDIPNDDRFTSEHDNRDTLAKAGIATTLVRDGVVFIQNLITYYHPDDVPDDTNAYDGFQKISRIQNILFNQFQLGNRWKNKTIVDAVEKVTSTPERREVVDAETVKGDMVSLIKLMIAKAWIRNEDVAIASILVAERGAGNGFDISANYILSGNALVRDINGFVDSAVTLAVAA